MKFFEKIKLWFEEQTSGKCSQCHREYTWNPNYYIWECTFCGEKQK